MAETDLKVIPLYRQAGRDLSALPGLHIAEPPRRASRSRKTDRLIMLLSFDVPAFSDERMADLLTRLEGIYFQKTGSTTSAMREMIEDLNNLILNLNLKYAGEKPQVTGSIGVIVVRGDLLFLAQCGPGHPFGLVPGKVDYLQDENLNMRGLGSSRTPTVYYSQMQFSAGDKFLFSTTLPDGWDANTFTAAYGASLHQAQKRFMADAGENLVGLMLDAEPGSGQLHLLQAPGVPQPSSPPREAAKKPAPERVPMVEPAAESAAPPQPVQPKPTLPLTEQPQPEIRKRVESRSAGEEPAVFHEPEFAPTAISWEPEEPLLKKTKDRVPSLQARETAAKLAPALLKGLQSVQAFGGKILGGLKKLLQRVMPSEELIKIPTGTMAFIAVAVPLLVVTVAGLVYAQIGRNQQYDQYFEQAKVIAQAALVEKDVATQREAWVQTINLLDTAMDYLATDEAENLRQQASEALDQLDSITRLTLEPALSGSLSHSVKIRKMVATSREIFMLDIDSDSVMRAWLAGSRFEIDPDFSCGSGKYGSIIVRELIDLALLPDNPDKAILVAMDRGGNLLYCFKDKPPVAITLTPPDSYWGKPIAITVENEKLYVLDEQLNMVWIYHPTDSSYQFRDAPFFYFTDEVPSMQETVDFAVDQEQLFLLYVNGQTTTCNYTGLEEAPATCTAPATYNDTRLGRTSGPKIEDAVFYQIQHTQPPEPSLFYLDPINRSVYHFSLKLNLWQQYKPEEGLEEGYITAFAVSPTKTIFLALENKVFLSHLP